jgi:histidinol-phosphate/aromatic aminotransferase/cobyric acid decarboxylase-like protein
MCEVLGGYFSAKLSETLLYNHKILIKDLSAKKGVKGQYIRVAVKTSEENNLLIAALYKTLGLTSRSKSYNLNFKLQEAL